ncbi:MAG: DUF362 domain-containing protein [archaeon]|nr:DUF362 domain-containing protein [archaeon]
MQNTKVMVKKLNASHDGNTFTEFRPLNEKMREEISNSVKTIFDFFGGKLMLKSSRDVFLKPNGIDGKFYCFTRPELIEAVINYWFDAGANKIYLAENSTQSNYTRVVFGGTGYDKVCKRTGAKPIYLDEEKTETFEFKSKSNVKEDSNGFDVTTFDLPMTVVNKLINGKEENLYINLPKLKTHSMAGVTLGIKNQWGFPSHKDRGWDHNYNLHYKFADVLSYVRPDFTLIEGVEGTINGHYPVTALADESVKPFKILIGSPNVLAADVIGAGIFGYGINEIQHLKISIEKGLGDGIKTVDDIELIGDIKSIKNIDIIGDMPDSGKYSSDILPKFPSDVNIIKGKEMCCIEGCHNNPLSLMQVLYLDYDGKGGWNLVIGKGFDTEEIDSLKGPCLVAGHCAIEEVGERLVNRLGKRNVYFSGKCNTLSETSAALFKLMKVSAFKMVTMPFFKSVKLLLLASLKSNSLVPSTLDLFKTLF